MSKLLLIALINMSFLCHSSEVFTVAISSTPSNLNPFFATDANSQNMNRLMHTTLVDFNESMKFDCVLCETFSEKLIDKRHVITFKLKENVSCADGSKITTKDVENSIKYFQEEEKIKSIFRFAFKKITNVEVIDEKTISLSYDEFNLENISNLLLLKIVKIPEYENLKTVTKKDIIGCGNYEIKGESELSFMLKPFKADLPAFNFKVVRDETTLALKILNNEIDVSIAQMSPRKVKYLEKTNKVKILKSPSTNYNYLGLNHGRKHLDKIEFRQALAHLIPIEKILKYKLKSTAIKSTGMFSPSFAQYYKERNYYPLNLKKAERLLSGLGMVKKDDGFWYKDNKIVELLFRISNNKSKVEMANSIAEVLQKGGIRINILVQEWGTYYKAFKSGEYDLVLGNWIGFTGPDMLNYAFNSEMIPPKGGNRGHYKNPIVDELLDSAKSMINEAERTELYKKVEDVAFRDLAYINLWHPFIIWIAQKDLLEIKLHPNGNFNPMLNLKRVKK